LLGTVNCKFCGVGRMENLKPSLIGGLIAAGVYHFTGSGFRWSTVGKWLVVSALVGFAVELFWRITRCNSS
jgi:hypothetical protein